MLTTRPSLAADAPHLYELPRRFRPRWPTILVVADEALSRRRLVDELRADGYTVHVADGHRSALVILRDLDPSLTVIDLPPRERGRLLASLRRFDPDARALLVEARSGDDLRRAVTDARRYDEDLPPAA